MTTVTAQAEFDVAFVPGRADQGLALQVAPAGVSCTIRVVGELDLATRNRLFLACTAGNHQFTTVDMSRLTFMDCSGYAGIVAARHVVEADGRTLAVRGLIGQPQHLMDLIARCERQPQQD